MFGLHSKLLHQETSICVSFVLLRPFDLVGVKIQPQAQSSEEVLKHWPDAQDLFGQFHPIQRNLYNKYVCIKDSSIGLNFNSRYTLQITLQSRRLTSFQMIPFLSDDFIFMSLK